MKTVLKNEQVQSLPSLIREYAHPQGSRSSLSRHILPSRMIGRLTAQVSACTSCLPRKTGLFAPKDEKLHESNSCILFTAIPYPMPLLSGKNSHTHKKFFLTSIYFGDQNCNSGHTLRFLPESFSKEDKEGQSYKGEKLGVQFSLRPSMQNRD